MDTIAFATLVAWIAYRTGAVLDAEDVKKLGELISVNEGCTPHAVKEMLTEMARPRKIEAIKLCRSITGLGLKESKDAIEAAMAQT